MLSFLVCFIGFYLGVGPPVRVAPLPGIPRDDHVVPQEQDAVQVHGPPGDPEEQVFPGVGAEESYLRFAVK